MTTPEKSAPQIPALVCELATCQAEGWQWAGHIKSATEGKHMKSLHQARPGDILELHNGQLYARRPRWHERTGQRIRGGISWCIFRALPALIRAVRP